MMRGTQMTISEIKAESGFTQRQLSEHLGIPLRTVEDWLSHRRSCPPYVLSLIEFRLRAEGIIRTVE